MITLYYYCNNSKYNHGFTTKIYPSNNRYKLFLGLLFLLLLLVNSVTGSFHTIYNEQRRRQHPIPLHSLEKGMVTKCRTEYITQPVDHFDRNNNNNNNINNVTTATKTYQQRYFINDDYYYNNNNNSTGTTKTTTIFFYLGNEADVTLYVNATGLMWENAAKFHAIVVFAEHRYYGHSLVQNNTDLSYLSVEQALMDYVQLVNYLKSKYTTTTSTLSKTRKSDTSNNNKKDEATTAAATIAFGGSYGGMLASWARIMYPNVFDGAIASSAPIITFEGMIPSNLVIRNYFTKGLTYTARHNSPSKSYPNCEHNLRKVFGDELLLTKIKPTSIIKEVFQLCEEDNNDHDNDDANTTIGLDATSWLSTAFSYMAMGNFPYRSQYILNGNGILPAFPISVACQHLQDDYNLPSTMELPNYVSNGINDSENNNNKHHYNTTMLVTIKKYLKGLASFAGVYYNNTGTLACNNLHHSVNNESQIVAELWDYQYCTQIFQIFEQQYSLDDMYVTKLWNGTQVAEDCDRKYGKISDRNHFAATYGSPINWTKTTTQNNAHDNDDDDAAGGVVSNIVWSQGEYDPWKDGGITSNISDTLISIVIPGAAHHLDLFFNHPNDTDAIREARRIQIHNIEKWITEKTKKNNIEKDNNNNNNMPPQTYKQTVVVKEK